MDSGLRLAHNRLARSVWMLLGHACVAIGTIGAYVPGLPTVSFYVLAAAFYARGSEKFYNWLLHHPVFGSYVRGQLTISALSAVLVAVPLTLFGVPYSLLLGLAAGLLNLIPSLGSVLTYVLGVTLMLAFGTFSDVLIVLAVLAVQALIEQAVLTPNIMSQQVGLHPVVILLALFVSGALFGLLGLVLAVPAAALVAGVVRARREALVIDLGDDEEDADTPGALPEAG